MSKVSREDFLRDPAAVLDRASSGPVTVVGVGGETRMVISTGVECVPVPCRHCNGTGKEYRWKDGDDGK